MRRKHLVAPIAVLITAATPALAGQKYAPITAEAAAQFKVGTASIQDVQAAFGKPSTITRQSNGSVMIFYSTVRAHVKAATFVPVVGLFAGGSTGEVSVISFTFGPDGILRSSSAIDSRSDCSVRLVGASCQGAAFAAPGAPAGANAAQSAPEKQMPTGSPALLGVTLAPLKPYMAAAIGQPDLKGLVIETVASGSVAERGGLKPGDCITSYNGSSMQEETDISRAIQSTKAGSVVEMAVMRAGKALTISLHF